MYLRPENRTRNLALVRCGGTMEDGAPCSAILEVPLYDRADCPICGWSVPSYSMHVAARSEPRVISKADATNHLPSHSAEPDTLSPAPLSSSP